MAKVAAAAPVAAHTPLTNPANLTRPIRRILSLDGGGIRGLITAIWLDALYKKLKEPLHEYFDLIAGTSTGAILACAVSSGIEPQRIIELYRDRGMNVFPSTSQKLWSRLTRVVSEGLSQPKYTSTGLKIELESVFKQDSFDGLKIKPTMVTAYDVSARHAVVFKNHKPEHKKLQIVDICMASAAAPTYFPCHEMILTGDDGVIAARPLVDGGVVANNPTACAIAEAVRLNCQFKKNENGLNDLLVASFGTGATTRAITAEDAKEWGTAEWAGPIVDVLFDGAADAVDYIAMQLIDEKRFFRFQTPLERALDDMDNAYPNNIDALIKTANDYLDGGEGKKKLVELAAALKADKASKP